MREETMQIFEDFELWLKTEFTNAFWFRRHKFEKVEGKSVRIDGGYFTKDEAKIIFKMLNSGNPITRFNATLMIWERNGLLTKLIIFLSILVLILIYIKIRV